jgi:hypothetical protein
MNALLHKKLELFQDSLAFHGIPAPIGSTVQSPAAAITYGMKFEQSSQMSQTPSVNIDLELSHIEAERAGSTFAAEASPMSFESPSVSIDLTELSQIEPGYSCCVKAAESPPLVYEQPISGGVVDVPWGTAVVERQLPAMIPFSPSSNDGTPESLFSPQSAIDFILR